TALFSGVPATVTPRPRRNSSRPSSRRSRSERKTVFVFTPSTAARSRAGGKRSPGFASPSAIALRISAATCSKSSVGSCLSILTFSIVLLTIALDDRATKASGARRARAPDQGGSGAAAEATGAQRRRARRHSGAGPEHLWLRHPRPTRPPPATSREGRPRRRATLPHIAALSHGRTEWSGRHDDRAGQARRRCVLAAARAAACPNPLAGRDSCGSRDWRHEGLGPASRAVA